MVRILDGLIYVHATVFGRYVYTQLATCDVIYVTRELLGENHRTPCFLGGGPAPAAAGHELGD